MTAPRDPLEEALDAYADETRGYMRPRSDVHTKGLRAAIQAYLRARAGQKRRGGVWTWEADELSAEATICEALAAELDPATAPARQYQFTIDGREGGTIRATWEAAAADAVGSGYAKWVNRALPHEGLIWDQTQGGAIVDPEPAEPAEQERE